MKTDRELLELAARAVGLIGSYYKDETGEVVYCNDENDCGYGWNPLRDNGDALWLAVKLQMTVKPGIAYSDLYGFMSCPPTEPGYDDVATRRAIVRAAAQMQLLKEGK